MKNWMKKMAIIGAVLFVGGIGVASIGAAIGGAAAGVDFLIDKEKTFQDKYDWGDSEEIQDDTEQLPEEDDVQDEMEEQLDGEELNEDGAALIPGGDGTVQPDEGNTVQPEENNTVQSEEQPLEGQPEGSGAAEPEQGVVNLPETDGQILENIGTESLDGQLDGTEIFV